MYETDWDFGEDYLNDFEDINTSFDDGDRTDLKKRKIDNNEAIFSETLNLQNNANNSILNSQLNTTASETKLNKRNKVLELFKKPSNNNVNEKSVDSQSALTQQKNEFPNSQKSQAINRRLKVAELFKNKNSEDCGVKETSSQNKLNSQEKTNSSMSEVISQSLQSSSNLQSQKHQSTIFNSTKLTNIPKPSKCGFSTSTQNPVFEPQPGTSKDSERWISQEKLTSKMTSSIVDLQNHSNSGVSKNNDRRKLVLDCFKKSETTVLPKRTLVRKFPGPAGLLPDDSEDSPVFMEITDSDSLKDDSLGKFDSSAFCSQRTKNLFTEGAWQLMLEDLPSNFLKGYDIASVKQKAKAKQFKYNKVPFMAGIVQSIDYSSNNPKIVLKDFSGEIECYLHCKIINTYPNVLDYGVVMLLRDVGLISSKMYLYAMVSQNSLVSMYSPKERIVSTSNLEIIQSGNSVDDFNQCVKSDNGVTEQRNNVNKQNQKQNDESQIFDNFFDDEMDFAQNDMDIEFSAVRNEPSSDDRGSTSKVTEPLFSSTLINNNNTSNGTASQQEQIESQKEVDNFFDMDDEAFFVVDEHISQVEESFFSTKSSKTRLLDSFKCNDSCQDRENKTEKSFGTQSSENNERIDQNKIAHLKKFNFQKKVPTAFLQTTINDTSNVNKTNSIKGLSTTTKDEKVKMIIETNKQSKNETKVESKGGVNVNSAKFKLLQFKRQDDESIPETEVTPPVIKSQYDDRSDLFSCDDDILMSQIELDSLEM